MRDMDKCPTCGEHMVGDGVTSVRHCENIDIGPLSGVEADAGPLYCCGQYYPGISECTGCVKLSTEAACRACIGEPS